MQCTPSSNTDVLPKCAAESDAQNDRCAKPVYAITGTYSTHDIDRNNPMDEGCRRSSSPIRQERNTARASFWTSIRTCGFLSISRVSPRLPCLTASNLLPLCFPALLLWLSSCSDSDSPLLESDPVSCSDSSLSECDPVSCSDSSLSESNLVSCSDPAYSCLSAWAS